MTEELKPCPFCGGEAGELRFDDVPQDDVNFGGAAISCKRCGACSPVHFDRKENLYSSWNDRANVVPAQGATTYPRPVEYEHDAKGNIVLPDGAPFDGAPVLIKLGSGWVEARWEDHDKMTDSGFGWVVLDDALGFTELGEAQEWALLPGVPAETTATNSDGGSAAGVPAQMQESNDCGLAQDAEKPEDTTQGDRPARPVTCPSECSSPAATDEQYSCPCGVGSEPCPRPDGRPACHSQPESAGVEAHIDQIATDNPDVPRGVIRAIIAEEPRG